MIQNAIIKEGVATKLVAAHEYKITDTNYSFFSDFIYLRKNYDFDRNPNNFISVPYSIWGTYLKDELPITTAKKIESDIDGLKAENIDMLATTFDLDFRVFELECLIDDSVYQMSPIESCKLNINTKEMRGNKTMALSQYEMAKKLILLGEYNREDMEYKLNRYLNRKVITQTEYDELIALMDASELLEK